MKRVWINMGVGVGCIGLLSLLLPARRPTAIPHLVQPKVEASH